MTIETRLAEIRARAEAATEGPWTAEYSGEQGNCVLPPGYQSTREAVAVTRLLSAQADAEFIAHARTDVPWLLGQVELRDKALEAVRELHQPEPYCNNAGHTNPDVECPECAEFCTADEELYPCRTITDLTAALEVEG